MRWIAVIAFLLVPTWAISNVSELSFDENDRLTTNYVLFVDNPSCQLDHDAYPYRPALPMSANLMSEFFEDSESIGDCAVVCLEKGVLKEHVVHPLPMHVGKQLESAANFVQANCAKTEVGFLSYNPNVADIFWVNGNKRQKVGTLKQGEKNTVWQVSYLGHKFLIEDTVTKEKLLELTVTHNAIYPIGDHKSARQVRNVEQGVQNTFQMEWHRAHRVTRTFTAYGFNKGRLPLDLWGSISAYYYNNRDNRILEEWDSKGLYVNWWEVDVFFIPMAYELKKVWQARIKELVEAWAGVDLETTDIYGMRRYEDGARLLTHVDREATHAASVIMNIAQNAIRTPWKVEIYDFANNLHEIEMDPGDIVYYESARCLHGRMQPLDGGYYVNLFAHYRPNGDPQWFSRSNPEGTPKQILDIGECSSDGIKATCTKEDVPYLSPKLEKLKGPDDLFRFWKETAPKTHSVGSKDEL